MPVEPHSTWMLRPKDFPPTTSISLKSDFKIEGLSILRVTSGRLAVLVASAVLARQLEMTHHPDDPLSRTCTHTKTASRQDDVPGIEMSATREQTKSLCYTVSV